MLIILYGPDTFRSLQKLNELKQKFIKTVDNNAYNVVVLENDKLELPKLKTEISATGFLTKKKMIIIKNIFGRDKDLQSSFLIFLKKLKGNENAIIIWDEKDLKKEKNDLAKYLLKQKFVQRFDLLESSQLKNWATREIKNRGGKIEKDALSELLELVSNDLWQLNSEIEKLINFRQEKIITRQDIQNFVKGKIDENIFKLTDAIGSKNTTSAIKIFNELSRSSLEAQYIFNMIIRHFKILIQVKDFSDRGQNNYHDIATQISQHPFAVQKALAQSRAFTLDGLKNIYHNLLKIDQKVKTSQADLDTLLNILIIQV